MWRIVGTFHPRRSTDLCASSGVLLNGSSWCTPYCSHQSHICGFSSFWNLATRTSSGDVCCRYWRATWSCKHMGRQEATWKPLWKKPLYYWVWVWNKAVSENKSCVSVASVLPCGFNLQRACVVTATWRWQSAWWSAGRWWLTDRRQTLPNGSMCSTII